MEGGLEATVRSGHAFPHLVDRHAHLRGGDDGESGCRRCALHRVGDCGASINPMVVEGRIFGASAGQGGGCRGMYDDEGKTHDHHTS